MSALLVLLLVTTFATAHAQSTRVESIFAVKGVAADDVLNIRDEANGDKIVGRIPPNGRGIVALGPRKRDQGTWAQVRYGSVTGWVNVRFLKPDNVEVASTGAPQLAVGALPRETGPGSDRLFAGVWSHEQWNLTIDSEQLAFLPTQNATQPVRILALGSRECGVVYERNFAAIDVEDIPSIFTDARFQTWARASSRERMVAVMIITCGSLSHRFFVFLTDMHKMLVAEWDEKAWLMYEEFTSGSRQAGHQ